MNTTEPQIGETFIRRSLNVRAGTPEQRLAWAEATEPRGQHVARIVYNRTTKVPETYVVLTVGNGVYAYDPRTFQEKWERA